MKKRSSKKKSSILKTPGSPPGTLVYTGEYFENKPSIELIGYNGTDAERKEISVEDLDKIDDSRVFWLNINGLSDTSLIEKIGSAFSINSLVLEDILHTSQRPKVEFYSEYMFAVMKMIYFDNESSRLTFEQISIVLTKNGVISFQEKPGDVFDGIRRRIIENKGIVRSNKADYLAYLIMDAVTDHYFHILEKFGEDIEEIEDLIVYKPDTSSISALHEVKRNLIMLRKSVWPLREVISGIERDDTGIISKELRFYIRDLYDHTIQIMDTVETQREMTAGLLDIYLSTLSNKMNEVMKVLTIIATIFIPLTFVAGVYGMNFAFMPELHFRWGYPAVLIGMFVLFLGMLYYFRKKKWI